MEQITKKDAAEMLTDEMINNLDDRVGRQNIVEILMYGCEGWMNQTNKELEEELFNKFDEKYKVI
jgi:hypothetical protein